MTVASVTTRGAAAALALLLGTSVGCKPAEPPAETTAQASPASPAAPAAPAATPAAPESPLLADAAKAGEAITADVLREPIAQLSDDKMLGRGPGKPGDPMARNYLVEQMKQIGLEPAGPNGDWMQPFAMVGINATPPVTWTFKAGSQQLALKRKDDFIAASGVQKPSAALKDAEIVFVGYGIQAPEFQWDDYKGQDMHGKVLLMMNNDPDWDPALFAGNRRLYYGRWMYKYEIAGKLGAAGAIIIHTQPSAGYPWQVVQSSWTGEQFELPDEGEPRVQVRSWITEDSAKKLAQLAGKNLDDLVAAAKKKDFQPVSLGVTTSLALKNAVRKVQTANVLGKLPGRDPQLADQVVIYSAHHDHLGVGEPDKSGDKIYNGALDNASGCSEILAIARAYKALPQAPRRTILFAFVAAEEQGLLGSKYYATHPTIAPGKIAADINYDGGDIWGKTKDITYVGMEKSNLADVVKKYAGQQGREVKPDQFPDRGYYYRSDQFSFAKIGVPAIYFDTGTDFVGKPAGWGKEQVEKYEAEHYHQPSDQLTPDWNFDGMIDDARLGFQCGLWIAEQDEMPAWTPGDEFEATRKQAIADAQSGATAAPTASPGATPSVTPSTAEKPKGEPEKGQPKDDDD